MIHWLNLLFGDDKCFRANKIMQEIDLLWPNEIHGTPMVHAAGFHQQIDAERFVEVSLVSSNIPTRNDLSDMVTFFSLQAET